MLNILAIKKFQVGLGLVKIAYNYFSFSSSTTSHRQVMNFSSQMIAVAQMTATNNKQENFANLQHLVKKAASKGAQMVFLPEGCDYIAESRKESLELAEMEDGPTLFNYSQLAKSLNIWLSIGGMHIKEEEDDKISNTHFIINNFGKIVGKYAKTHLFNVKIPESNIDLRESQYVEAGVCIPSPVVTPCGLLALGICYDMRFPEFSLLHRKANAQILSFPSAFTVPTGLAHWHTLLRARAIETQCYVVAAAQVGAHNRKRSSFGHSVIIDPWGAVIAEVSEGSDVAWAEVDLKYLNKIRNEMPVFKHRRNDLYSLHKIPGLSSEVGLTELLPFPCDFVSYPFGQVSVPGSCIFLQTMHCHAFVNRKPVAPGHALVAPKKPTLRFCDMEEAEVSDLAQAIVLTLLVIMENRSPPWIQVAIQDGVFAGQTIKHVHAHLVPLAEGGEKKKKKKKKQQLAQGHEARDAAREWRAEADMAGEAKGLRRHAHAHAHAHWLATHTPKIVRQEDPQTIANEVEIPPDKIFYRSGSCFAFLPGNSILPGHVCISPFEPASSLSNLSPVEVSDMFLAIQRIQKLVEKYYDANSSTIYTNNALEGKTLLIHVLPRKENDVANNDDIYGLLLSHTLKAPDDSQTPLLSYLRKHLPAQGNENYGVHNEDEG